jgi:glycine/D-amino acid oxidase-like deaminating enzyme
VIGLSAARALVDDGFAVTVYERDRVGSRLGSSPGRSRIYRRSYRMPDYVRLARRAIEEWQRLDAGLLHNTGLLEYGAGVELHAAAMDACGEEYRWLAPAEAAENPARAMLLDGALDCGCAAGLLHRHQRHVIGH